MTAAPPEPSDPKDMATTEKKPKGVEVFVRLEETDKEHRFALRCTLPSRWLGRKSLRSLLDTFFDAYERARPNAPHARRDAALGATRRDRSSTSIHYYRKTWAMNGRSGCGFRRLPSFLERQKRIRRS